MTDEPKSIVEVYACHRRALTISAIKYIRTLRNLDLRSAKDLIDIVYYGGRSITLDFDSLADARAFAEQMREFRFSCRIDGAEEPTKAH